MQTNPDYDLSKPIQTAIKASAPYVGIPLPGHAALMFKRERLSRALKGVRPVNIEVIVEDNGERYLLIEGYAGRVRTRMRFRSLSHRWFRTYEGRKALDAWHNAEFRKRKTTAVIPSGADRKTAAQIKKAVTTLKRLQKELDGMGCPNTLRNPAVPYIHRYKADDVYERGYLEQHRLNWIGMRETKRLRTIIGGIAAQARRDAWTTTRLYKELAAHGIRYTKLSDMTASQRERRGAATIFDYVRNLYKFCEGGDRVYYRYDWERNKGDGQEWGPDRYWRKLADIQERRALQSQIDSVKAILAALRGGPTVAHDVRLDEAAEAMAA